MSNSLGERVLTVLNAAAGQPLKAKDVSRALGLSSDDRATIRSALFDLCDDGRAVQLPGRRFVSATAQRPNTGIKGSVQRKPSGIAWFVPHDRSLKDAFIPPTELSGLVDGDVVAAVISRAPKGPIAKITQILERTRTHITGSLRASHDRRRGRSYVVDVDDNVLSGPVVVDAFDGGDAAKDGDIVEVELTDYPTAQHPAKGTVVRRLGRRGALDVEIERLVTSAGVLRTFPSVVLDEASALGEVPTAQDWKGRQDDVRHLPIVTIDGETAKDFDDAVYAKKRGKKIDVIVCVADVSYYVTNNSPLDREARARGTSIYYPGRVIPMLPEALSNGLCSLRPHVPRLCTAVFFSVDEKGGVHDERLSFAVMESRARLTYSLVQRFLDEEEGKDEPFAMPPQPKEALASTKLLDDDTKTSLRALAEASRRLRAGRQARGALDFELPELIVELDEQKEPTGLRHNERVESQKLIEDLMIAANEAAARFFFEQNAPSIYRIHEKPDEEKLGRFLELARPAFTEQTKQPLPKSVINDPTSPSALMTLMRGVGDHPSRQALDMLLLRSMKQARYSTDNVGHYGLGSTAYLHFTSPIRRYPDLIVHRLLRDRLAKKKKKKHDDEGANDALQHELDGVAESSSDLERKAADLERQIQQLHACWLMKDRIGEVHEAIVTGVSEAGAFVRLTSLHTEGLVRVDALGREYFTFMPDTLRLIGERSRDVIAIGTKMQVEVIDVDLSRRQIAFAKAKDLTLPKKQPKAPPPKERAPDEPWRPRDDVRRKPDEERAHVQRERDERRAQRDSRYQRQQQRGSKPVVDDAPKPRPAIRGPDDLRALFDAKPAEAPAQKHKRSTKPAPKPKKKPPRKAGKAKTR